jgi:hypothetical protein
MATRLFSILFVLVGFSIACNLGSLNTDPNVSITSIPIETNTSLPNPTDTTPAQSNPKLEVISIFEPALGSTITSPITVKGKANSTFEQNLVVLITDEGGSQLAIGPTTINAPLGDRGPYSVTLSYSVGSDQAGRISVYSVSAMTGGLEHLSSVEVQLMPSGSPIISSDSQENESIQILSPKPLASIQGGSVQVSGQSDYYFESSLGLVLCGAGASGVDDEICGTASNILATGVAQISSPDIGLPGPFSGTLSYSVTSQTTGRIVVYATSARDGGIIHLSSVPIEIMP